MRVFFADVALLIEAWKPHSQLYGLPPRVDELFSL